MTATEFGGALYDRFFSFDVAGVDLASHAAGAAVDTVVNCPSGITLQASDLIVAVPPATLNAPIHVQSARYTSASTLTLRTGNASAGAVDPAAATWTFLVFRR